MANYDWISNCLTFIIDVDLNSVIKMREQQLIVFYMLLCFLNLVVVTIYAYVIVAIQQFTGTQKSWTFNHFIVT
jgi:hypothetical protein